MSAPASSTRWRASRSRGLHWSDRLAQALLLAAGAALVVFLAAPLAAVLARSVQDRAGAFIGWSGFAAYLETPALWICAWNSLWVSALVTLCTLPIAFGFAYALTRSCMPLKGLLRGIALIPILAPSLLPAISFLFWFGNQGLLRPWLAWLGWSEIYGAPGIVISLVFAALPHALMILVSALSLADARLLEAADALGASAWRKLVTLTLPGAKYGLLSAAMVVFTYAISDFGAPKVIGGNFPMLATEVFRQVIGQQDFGKGAVVAVFLLVPVWIGCAAERAVRRRATAQLSTRAVAYRPQPRRGFDRAMSAFCWAVALALLAVLGMAVYASFVKLWPYDFRVSLDHYRMGLIDAGIFSAYAHSVRMALWTALVGTAFIFGVAYLLEKTRGVDWARPGLRILAAVPMGVPGLVLGLGYVLFFVDRANPLHGLYHTTAILVICTVVHYYSSSHWTAVTALQQLDGEFEAVSISLRVPFYRTLFRVTAPLCAASILDIARYLFVNAMTTVSAVVFLYAPRTMPASVAIVNLDEAGDIGPAAAMATLIVATSAAFCLLHGAGAAIALRRTDAWRKG